MRPTLLRNMLSKFAPIGRMFMQKIKEQKSEKRKRKGGPRIGSEKFSEGWVEFLKKRHAKQVAALLNNQPMGGKKKSKFHDCLWNLKYLSRFKWIHLVERLGYERAVLRQRMQNEISQAKRVASFFKDTVDREERQRRKAKAKAKSNNGEAADSPDPGPSSSYVFTQRKTAEEKKAKRGDVGSAVTQEREKFLKSLFS
ncbi:unnamed protein product [Nesidiocoris tenuis]|nr:unnamed protein product [Nesidiocoris tenuis]CAB0010994.1 unnamed protein product [Nesidiocoris tenuis]